MRPDSGPSAWGSRRTKARAVGVEARARAPPPRRRARGRSASRRRCRPTIASSVTWRPSERKAIEKGSGAGSGLRNDTKAVSARAGSARGCPPARAPASRCRRRPPPGRRAGRARRPGRATRTPTTRSPSRSRSTSSCSQRISTPSRSASSTAWRATEMATGWSLRWGGMSMPWARIGPSTPISSRASYAWKGSMIGPGTRRSTGARSIIGRLAAAQRDAARQHQPRHPRRPRSPPAWLTPVARRPAQATVVACSPWSSTRSDCPLRAVERDVPVAGPGQLLLRVRACAVCRTDLHLMDGEVDVPAPATRAGPSDRRHRRRRPRAGRRAVARVDVRGVPLLHVRPREPVPAGPLHRARHRRRHGRVRGRRRALLLPAARRARRRRPGPAAVRGADRLPLAHDVRRRAPGGPVRVRRGRPHHRPGRCAGRGARSTRSRARATTAAQDLARELGAAWAGGSDERPARGARRRDRLRPGRRAGAARRWRCWRPAGRWCSAGST